MACEERPDDLDEPVDGARGGARRRRRRLAGGAGEAVGVDVAQAAERAEPGQRHGAADEGEAGGD
jgi:hypothetical protein